MKSVMNTENARNGGISTPGSRANFAGFAFKGFLVMKLRRDIRPTSKLVDLRAVNAIKLTGF